MAPRTKLPPISFTTWLKSSKPGEALTYHMDGSRPDDRLFIAAWEAHMHGTVALFQKRVNGVLHYLAVRLSPRSTRFMAWAPRQVQS